MEKNRFKEALLERKEFIYTHELVPGRGSPGKTQDNILRIAEGAAQSKLVHAVSITDNPGGHPAPHTPPRNWELDQTSSWANYFLGRDHHGQK